MREYLEAEVKPVISNKHGEELLEGLVKVWDAYVIYSKMMDRTFEYLNRYYLRNNQLQLVGEKCMALFNDYVFSERKGQFTAAVLQEISRDRSGEAI